MQPLKPDSSSWTQGNIRKDKELKKTEGKMSVAGETGTTKDAKVTKRTSGKEADVVGDSLTRKRANANATQSHSINKAVVVNNNSPSLEEPKKSAEGTKKSLVEAKNTKSEENSTTLDKVRNLLSQIKSSKSVTNETLMAYEDLHTHVQSLKKELATATVNKENRKGSESFEEALQLLEDNIGIIEQSDTLKKLKNEEVNKEKFVKVLNEFYDKTLPSIEKFADKSSKFLSLNREMANVKEIADLNNTLQELAGALKKAKKEGKFENGVYENLRDEKLSNIYNKLKSLGFNEIHLIELQSYYQKELYDLKGKLG